MTAIVFALAGLLLGYILGFMEARSIAMKMLRASRSALEGEPPS